MITFNTQNIDMPPIDTARTVQWLTDVAATYQRKVGDINYIFTDDATILDMNRQFIGHDYYTDHIGFDYCHGSILSGDIYISLDTVRTNAQLYAPNYMNELHRVIVHGMLHLVGIKDKTPEERQQMEAAEDKALASIILVKSE